MLFLPKETRTGDALSHACGNVALRKRRREKWKQRGKRDKKGEIRGRERESRIRLGQTSLCGAIRHAFAPREYSFGESTSVNSLIASRPSSPGFDSRFCHRVRTYEKFSTNREYSLSPTETRTRNVSEYAKGNWTINRNIASLGGRQSR